MLAVSYGLERTITDLENAAACLVGPLLWRRLLSLRCAQSDHFKHGLSISIRRRPDWECQHRRRMRNSVGSCRHAENHLALLRCSVRPGYRSQHVVNAFQRSPPLKPTRSAAQADRERVYRNLSDYCRIHPVPVFFNHEGARFFKTQTEVRLAGEIHRTLVPPRHQTIGNVELFGRSIPSSEVGGDLFDFVEGDGAWHAYVADVSGHGLAAGILMSMIKSAASMQLNKLKKPADLLADLNDVMQPFTSPANYLTFAYVGGNGTDRMSFALAGHLPILHYEAQAKVVVERSDSNVPIGLFKNQTFQSSHLTLQPGDLLAIITDGFTEVFDKKDREIGMAEFKSMLLACAEKPLPEIYRELRANTMAFGKQTDDQTMLLIRRVA